MQGDALTTIEGEAAAGYEGVRDAFVANFGDHGEVGAACSVYVGGEKVVDLWGGVADDRTERPWDEQTLAPVFSTTKGVAAICAHHLAQQGILDLDAPVADVWPEFAAAGKEGVTTRMFLSHRSGLPTISTPLTPEQAFAWTPMAEALAAEAPLWEPGTAHGYHALTYGYLVGEVVRRVTGRSIGTYLADEIAKPLELDTYIGLPESEEHRVARLITGGALGALGGDGGSGGSGGGLAAMLEQLPEAVREMVTAMMDPDSILQRALMPTRPPINWNSREAHAAEIPAGGGITSARSLAKLYAACVGTIDGIRVLDAATVEDATREQSNGPDRVLTLPTRFGSGFFLSSPFSPLLGDRSFGHAGAGGSLGFADPDGQVGFGYVMNKMQQNMAGDPRTLTLIKALKRSLA